MVLIRNKGELSWRSPTVTSYPDEAALEYLLTESPELLPGFSSSPFVVARQVSVGAGSIDILGVGLDGSIAVVECKLRANPEIRRAVVGQLFAYASSLWGMSYDALDRAIAARLPGSLAVAAAARNGGAELDEPGFRANVERNLRDGRFRLVIAVDSITDELRRIVEYLNEHTIEEIDVIALELGYMADDSVEIVIPTLYGLESAKAKPGAKHPVGEAELFAALEATCTATGVAAVRRLYDRVKPMGGDFAWGLGIAYPSTNAWFTVEGNWVCTWSCYARSTTPTWDVDFEYLVKKGVSIGRVERLAERLRSINGVAPRLQGLEAAAFRKRPSLSIDAILTQPGAIDTIEAALDELLAD